MTLYVKPEDLHTHSPDCRGSGCEEVMRVLDHQAEVARLTAENAELRRCLDGGVDCAGEKALLREALEDFRDYGLRFDLNPTHNISYPACEVFWHDYARRMDQSVRERACNALNKAVQS